MEIWGKIRKVELLRTRDCEAETSRHVVFGVVVKMMQIIWKQKTLSEQ